MLEIKLPLHRFTIEEYHRLAEVGILHEDNNVELIEGKIIDLSPIGIRHSGTVKYLNELLFRKLKERAIIGVQDPINIYDQSEPEPDITILKRRDDFYRNALPQPNGCFINYRSC